MKWSTRSLMIATGLLIIFVAILLLVARPVSHVLILLPPFKATHNLPYYFYLRAFQAVLGSRAIVPMIANSLLVVLTCIGVFRVSWGVTDPRYGRPSAAAAMLFFELNPLVIILPLTLGYLGGYLFVPLLLLIFIATLINTQHWSVFMRSLVLAVVWSLFLWVHLPAALIVLAAMIPWVIYNRRPLPALGIFLTMLFLGIVLFSVIWSIGCAIARHWSLIQSPVGTLHALWSYLHAGVVSAEVGSSEFKDRLIHVTAWLSPFFIISGLWASGRVIRRLLKERRASTSDFMALIALVVLGVVLCSSGKDILPGAWYLILIMALWSPLVAQTMARKENFYSRGSRLTFLVGFIVCAVTLALLTQNGFRGSLVPGGSELLSVFLVVLVFGGLAHAALRKHPLSWAERAHALLAGATLAYYIVVDSLLLR